MPDKDSLLHELDNSQYEEIKQAIQELIESKASDSLRQGQVVSKRIGAVAASKLLLGINKNVFLPWDNAIIKGLGLTNNSDGYITYLMGVASQIRNLEQECISAGMRLDSIPEEFKRPGTKIPKLIDEYYFLKFTRNCDSSIITKFFS